MNKSFLGSSDNPAAWLKALAGFIRNSPRLKKMVHPLVFSGDGQARAPFRKIYGSLVQTEQPACEISDSFQEDIEPAPLADDIILRRFRAQANPPHLTVLAMARNEKKRSHDIMRHFCALFDRVVVVDHMSDDGTGNIVKGYDGAGNARVTVLRGTDNGHYQSQYMSALANAALEQGETDWIFLLDFDEFLPFQNAREFRRALCAYADVPVINMPWINAAVIGEHPDSLSGAHAIVGPRASIFRKIALNASMLGPRHVEIPMGNHTVFLNGEPNDRRGAEAFGLLHFPVLDYEALRKKVAQGNNAISAMTSREDLWGIHWRQMGEVMDQLSDEKILREIILNYSMPIQPILEAVAAGKFTPSREITLRIAQTDMASESGPFTPLQISVANADDAAAAIFPHPGRQNAAALLPEPYYESLKPRMASSNAGEALPVGLKGIFNERLSGAQILFGILYSLFRPVRLVELGSNVFIPYACDLLAQNSAKGEAIVVGDWPDTCDTGQEGEAAPEKCYAKVRSAYAPAGGPCKFIRGLHDAVNVFAAGSIDMLVFNVPADYGRARDILETWSRKLAATGVVILRSQSGIAATPEALQIYEHWATTRAQAAFSFLNTGGPALLAFGLPENDPTLEFIGLLNANPFMAEYLLGWQRREEPCVT